MYEDLSISLGKVFLLYIGINYHKSDTCDRSSHDALVLREPPCCSLTRVLIKVQS